MLKIVEWKEDTFPENMDYMNGRITVTFEECETLREKRGILKTVMVPYFFVTHFRHAQKPVTKMYKTQYPALRYAKKLAALWSYNVKISFE